MDLTARKRKKKDDAFQEIDTTNNEPDVTEEVEETIMPEVERKRIINQRDESGQENVAVGNFKCPARSH